MADDYDYGEGLSPVDQGTILMLCLSLGLAVLAAFWFGCRWYKKKHKTFIKPRLGRPRLKQTFSRFSQVDEALTMHHITEDDAEILQRYSVHEPNTSAMHVETHSSPATETRVTMTEKKKPYLETDI